jgi:hypothetical protein
MNATLRMSALLLLATLGLAGCKEDSTDTVVAPQDQFGDTFSKAFRAEPTDPPINPMPGDAGTLTLTGQPVDF